MENRKHYSSGRRNISNRAYYFDGSAARNPEVYPRRKRTTRPMPGKQSRPQHRRMPARTARQRQLAEKQRRVNERIAMRNREKAFRLDLKYTLFFCVVLMITLGCCVFYLMTQSAVTQKNLEITQLTSELSLLTNTNAATRERINDAIDLDYVREYARNVLGMGYPSASQIITYQGSEDDYVKQYQDIPQSGE